MNLIIIIVVGALFLTVLLRMVFAKGSPGPTNSTSFPYDTGSTIAPPSWSPDSGNDSQCEVSDGGWSDSGGDSGSCDSGGDGGSGGD